MKKYDDIDTDAIPLREIVWHNLKPITGGTLIHISDDHRLYYKLNEIPGSGFDFCFVEFASASGDFGVSVWDDPNVEVEKIAFGNALFDGLRHFYIPYWHYVNGKDLVKLAREIELLITIHCKDV